MARKQKLELTWIGKENRPKLEPRILLEDTEKSYHAAHRVTDDDIFDNRLIYGDNLLALKALEKEFRGKVKCVYIDPPFNTGEAFEHYDDGVEHSLWLSLMRERLSILKTLLSDDGTIFVHIDDNELGYLIVLMDELFGRSNKLYVLSFKQGSATGHKAINPGCVNTTNFILMYAKDKAAWSPNRLFTSRERDVRYNQFVSNKECRYENWQVQTLMSAYAESRGLSEKEARTRAKSDPDDINEFVVENADRVVQFARPDYNGVSEAARRMIDASKSSPNKVFLLEREDHSDMYFKGGQRFLFYTAKLKQIDGTLVAGEPLTTLWDDILSNNIHKEGGVTFPKGKKPEALIKRVLEISTKPGDLILDSFAGSGTTGSVAHKLGRRWIMVELGEHCDTHVHPRIRNVVTGRDQDGISKSVNWKGGGGFRYYTLAPSLLQEDEFGNWIINKKYNPEMLAEALCKLEGFTYAPSTDFYWKHGHSTETDFIYVTTQTLTREQLQKLSDEVGAKRSLLICCAAFRVKKLDDFPNLTLKKIPLAVMSKCEWGKDDYSLAIKALPDAPEPEPVEFAEVVQDLPKNKRKARKVLDQQASLFANDMG